MAKDLTALRQQADTIRNEKTKNANTAERIGGMFADMLDYMQDGGGSSSFKGYFADSESLNARYPSPQTGDYAWVGEPYPGNVYNVVDGKWHDTGEKADGGLDPSEFATKEELKKKQDNISSVEVDVDNLTGTPSATATLSEGVMTFSFKNLKGEKGEQGSSNLLKIGSVSVSDNIEDASASITGESPEQTLNLVLPRGPQGNSGVNGDTTKIVVVNDLNGGESTEESIKVLAAEQGKVLDRMISDKTSDSTDLLKTHEALSDSYLTPSGSVNTLSGGIVSPLIPVKQGDRFRFIGGWKANGDINMVYLYTGKNIAGTPVVASADSIDTVVEVPEGYSYMRAWSMNDRECSLYRISSTIDHVYNKINDCYDAVNGQMYDYLHNNDSLSDSYLTPAGNIATLSGAVASSLISVIPGERYHYVGGWKANEEINMVYLYTGKNIAGTPVVASADSIDTVVEVPEGYSYMRAWSMNDRECFLCKESSIADTINTNKINVSLIMSKISDLIEGNETIVVATRNSIDYNSIREIVASLDATANNPYIVFIPRGRWHECDLTGKKYVTLVGEDMDDTILYNDGDSDMTTPSDYSFSQYASKKLSEIDRVYKHVVNMRDDIAIKNLTLECSISKYCAHCDSGNFNKGKFQNVVFHSKTNVNHPVGIGVRGDQTLTFESCRFVTDTYGIGVFAHNWNNQDRPSMVDIQNCSFVNCGYMLVDELGSEQNDGWNLLNCSSESGEIRAMVDVTEDGNCYYVNNEGVHEPNPQNVPYNIHLNTHGSNVKSIFSTTFSGNMKVSSRPNIEKYISSENILIIKKESYKIGQCLFGSPTLNGMNWSYDMPFVGIVQNIIGDYAYVLRRGIANIPLSISGLTYGTELYVDSDGMLTTDNTGRLIGYYIEKNGDLSRILIYKKDE